jgi:hypothetical protein
MTEYFRLPENQIQAGFALNAGKLLAHYCSLTKELPFDQKYEATLAICVLQSLLTNCTELLRAMEDHQKQFFTQAITDERPCWALTLALIAHNSFPGNVTLERMLIHMRNALSHPTAAKATVLPATGFTTSNDPSSRLSAFRLTDSPWEKDGALHWPALPMTEKKARAKIDSFEEEYRGEGFLDIVGSASQSRIARDGKPYLPVFVVELPLAVVINLAVELARLAQPTQEEWNGNSINSLVALAPVRSTSGWPLIQ